MYRSSFNHKGFSSP